MNHNSLPPNPTTQEWQPGHVLLDDYEVVRVLGEGGMGKVYLVNSRSTASQFAVKRAKGLNDSDRKNFLAELQTWIDLPHHPNLVPCRFFRTVGTEVLIFAEYVEGGSLKDWIDSKRVYEGGPDQALERMLDIAIQFAWGLHCIHELGTVHQDVKPSNVLMGKDGKTGVQGVKPQITDYGLARARAAAGEDFDIGSSKNIIVSSVRGTPAYWSPEQAGGLPLTHKTDIWSWGVAVLELFTGEVTWMSGRGAADVLEQYLQQDEDSDAIPPMPGGLADLLRLCFQEEPLARMATLTEAVKELHTIYQKSVGNDYSRTLDVIELTTMPQSEIRVRRTTFGTTWTAPRVWLEKALRAAGRDPGEAEAMVARHGVTRRGEFVAELAGYDKAKRLYEKLIFGGRKELEGELATLCINKASVHRMAGDEHGALQDFDQAIAIQERLVNNEGPCIHAGGLATSYMNKAISVSTLGNHPRAVVLYHQAITLLERMINKEGRSDLMDHLAMAYQNNGIAASALGKKYEAVALYDQAIAIRERLVNKEGRCDLANGLAMTYMNKALSISAIGSVHVAVALYDQAIAIRERLVNQEGRSELANDLAMTYMSKGNAVDVLGNKHEAVALYDQAIAILERLVNQEGRSELANDLAMTYMNKGNAVSNLGDNHGAIALYDQAIAIRERLVNQEGRTELANDLAMAYLNKGNAVGDLGDKHGAITHYDQAIAIRERLVNQDDRRELANDLAGSYMNKANSLSNLGDKRGAVKLYDQAIAIRERLVNLEGHRELAAALALTFANKAFTVNSLGDQRGAVVLYEQAIAIRERLVNLEGRSELAGDLARTRAYRDEILIVLGENAKGSQDKRSAQTKQEAEIVRTGRAPKNQVLAWLRNLTKHSS